MHEHPDGAQKHVLVCGAGRPRRGARCACMQATRRTGNGSHEFDPAQWLSDDRRSVRANVDAGNFVWGAGARRCIGAQLATIEITTVLMILAREVQHIGIAPEDLQAVFRPNDTHPTGLPVHFTPAPHA
jgi:cytochrome P450